MFFLFPFGFRYLLWGKKTIIHVFLCFHHMDRPPLGLFASLLRGGFGAQRSHSDGDSPLPLRQSGRGSSDGTLGGGGFLKDA